MKRLMLAVLALSAHTALAAPEVKAWVNPECARGTCEVKSLKLILTKTLTADYAGRAMVAELETSQAPQLKKYALVQYLRGCLFTADANGPVKLGTREYLTRSGRPFKHVGWEVDSASDLDPIYWSTLNPGWDELRGFEITRNANYSYTNPNDGGDPERWAGKTSNIKGRSRLYVADTPSPAMAGGMTNGRPSVTNSSLEFRICLHEISKIPKTLATPGTMVAEPIVCLDWASNFTYDFAARRFKERQALHSYCL